MRHYPLSTLNSPLSTLHSPLSTINYYLALAGLWENWGIPDPAVALRFTAGYAFHTPNGVKSKKQKFH
ncbi:MAG: hypothetical protein LBE12_19125 [Planctomycetaceae bacterium]|nr:hypothetical protein [Planctomycetaceae bacterium]